MTFSDRLKELMKQYDYKQVPLAEKLGVSQQTISRWVNGKFQPDIDQLLMLGKLFNVTVDDLLGQSDDSIRNTKQPTVDDDGLRAWAIERVSGLSDPALERVRDFLTGLEAGQEIGAAPAADRDPDAGSSE